MVAFASTEQPSRCSCSFDWQMAGSNPRRAMPPHIFVLVTTRNRHLPLDHLDREFGALPSISYTTTRWNIFLTTFSIWQQASLVRESTIYYVCTEKDSGNESTRHLFNSRKSNVHLPSAEPPFFLKVRKFRTKVVIRRFSLSGKHEFTEKRPFGQNGEEIRR